MASRRPLHSGMGGDSPPPRRPDGPALPLGSYWGCTGHNWRDRASRPRLVKVTIYKSLLTNEIFTDHGDTES